MDGDGRQIGGIRLDEQSIRRDLFRDLAQILCLAKGKNAPKGDMETEVQTTLGRLEASGEAVQNAPRTLRELFLQNLAGQLLRFPRMNDHGFASFSRLLKLLSEGFNLLRARGIFVVKVQPDFS